MNKLRTLKLTALVVVLIIFLPWLCTAQTIFGAMVFDAPDTLQQKLTVLDSLGLNLTRESQLTTTWKGSNGRMKFWNNNRVGVMLNINYMPQGGTPFVPIEQFTGYADTVKDIVSKCPAEWYVIENEESNPAYHTGDMVDYVLQLNVAIDAVHAAGGQVCNGGITMKMLLQLTISDLLATDPNRARQIAAAYGLSTTVSKKKQAQMNWVVYELYYLAASRVDAVNVHFSHLTKTDGLAEMIAYLKRITNKPIISNEVAFDVQDYSLVRNVMNIFNDSGMEWVCFWSGKKGRLHTSTGALTRNGQAVKDYTY